MQLEYIWIKKWYCLENQDVNFGGPIRCYYDDKAKNLILNSNENYIDNFFNISPNDNIKNITALIGKNGAGKTTFLKFIIENLLNASGGVKTDIVLVYYNQNTINVFASKKLVPSIDNIIINELKIDVKLHLYEIKKEKGMIINANFPVRETAMIYYSNVIDDNYILDNYENFYNISSSSIMTNIEEDIRRDYGNYALDKKPTFTKSSISDYRLSEIKKEILFIRNFDTQNSSNFKSFFVSDFQQTISISTNFDPNKINKKFYDGKKQLQTLIDELTSVLSDFRLELYKAVMLNFIYEISTFTSNIPDQSSLQKHMNQLASGKDIYEKVINYFTKLKESYNNTSTGKNENGIIIDYKVKDYINQIDAIVSFLSYFDDKIKIIYDQDKLKGFNSLLNMAVPLKLSLYSENFEEFMNLYQSTYRFTDYLTFEWAGLSSGEKTLLGIYSRLFSVCDLARKSNEKKIRDKDILLLMDEADTYLHPQWQKEFLLRMIKYLPAIFPSNNIQILITSHSPILTSDLPGSNVAFLGVDNIKEVKTFAANIHDLYADSFYFDTVPIGNFAHLIIDSLIKQIKDKDSDIDLKFFNSILQIVGEPTLYNFLEREYLSFAKPREKIDLLKRKIEEIEKGIEND